MCILWLYIGDEKCGDTEQLILASNRDEFLHRSTSGVRIRQPSDYKASIKRPKQRFLDELNLPIKKPEDIFSLKSDGCDVVHRLGEEAGGGGLLGGGEGGDGEGVRFLGPRDEEGGSHGTWFVCNNR